jgi:hypothetical protein
VHATRSHAGRPAAALSHPNRKEYAP